MEFASLHCGQIYIVRIDPGEDVLAAIESFLQESKIRQAVVLGGYGTLAAYHVHWVTHNRLPAENRYGHGEGGIEILSMNGLVVDGRPHVHISLSNAHGAFGGHLESGCIAYVVCEMFLAEVDGLQLSRQRVPISVEGMGQGTTSRLTFEQK